MLQLLPRLIEGLDETTDPVGAVLPKPGNEARTRSSGSIPHYRLDEAPRVFRITPHDRRELSPDGSLGGEPYLPECTGKDYDSARPSARTYSPRHCQDQESPNRMESEPVRHLEEKSPRGEG